MQKIKNLAKTFDRQQHHICCTALPPTSNSILRIEEVLKIHLPKSFIAFAQHSKQYGNWLASIGEDYRSETHIINMNQESHGSSSNEIQKPSNFIIFNVGYDEDFNCFDSETYDEDIDEYLITYWYPGVDLRESSLYGSFYNYMHAQILGWSYT